MNLLLSISIISSTSGGTPGETDAYDRTTIDRIQQALEALIVEHVPDQDMTAKIEIKKPVGMLRRLVRDANYRGSVLLRGDSQLVVKQYSGEWACHKEHLRALRDKLRHAATFFEALRLEWIPREQNERADALAWRAHEQQTGLRR